MCIKATEIKGVTVKTLKFFLHGLGIYWEFPLPFTKKAKENKTKTSKAKFKTKSQTSY